MEKSFLIQPCVGREDLPARPLVCIFLCSRTHTEGGGMGWKKCYGLWVLKNVMCKISYWFTRKVL